MQHCNVQVKYSATPIAVSGALKRWYWVKVSSLSSTSPVGPNNHGFDLAASRLHNVSGPLLLILFLRFGSFFCVLLILVVATVVTSENSHPYPINVGHFVELC